MPSVTEDAERKGEHGNPERDKDVANNTEEGGSNADDATTDADTGSGEGTKRKNNEVAATPEQTTSRRATLKGKGSERSEGRETKKKRGGIKELFDRMNKQKEEMKNDSSAKKSSEATPHIGRGSGEGWTIENPPVILKTPTPSLFPKGSMKPSQIKKAQVQSAKVKEANKKFAAAAANKEGLKNDKGESNEGGKEPSGFVSFSGEQPKFKEYMYVEFKVQVDKQKGKKTKECFEDTISGGIDFLRESMSQGKSNFSIVPKKESNATSKVIKSRKDFPKHQHGWKSIYSCLF